MFLVYGYTTHMNRYEDNEWVVSYYTASIRKSKSLGYYIKMYGCDYMQLHLESEVDEFINIENHQFDYTDDLKIYIHSNENIDCITIDGDVILDSKLKNHIQYDVLFDRKGQVNHSKEISKYRTHLNVFQKYDVESNVKYFDYNGEYACNVGIIKFNNIDVKKKMIDSYDEFKSYYKKNIEPFEKLNDPAIILCEYNFERIISKEGIKVGFYNDHDMYMHYANYMKFEKEFTKRVSDILNPHNRAII